MEFTKKVSNFIDSQVPEFVLEDHPKFVEFLKTYYTLMESAELTIINSQSTEGILLETETGQFNNLVLDASRLGSEATQIDAGSKILQETSSYGDFTMGEIIKGQTSKATSMILAESNGDGKFIVKVQDKFLKDEVVVGLTSGGFWCYRKLQT